MKKVFFFCLLSLRPSCELAGEQMFVWDGMTEAFLGADQKRSTKNFEWKKGERRTEDEGWDFNFGKGKQKNISEDESNVSKGFSGSCRLDCDYGTVVRYTGDFKRMTCIWSLC